MSDRWRRVVAARLRFSLHTLERYSVSHVSRGGVLYSHHHICACNQRNICQHTQFFFNFELHLKNAEVHLRMMRDESMAASAVLSVTRLSICAPQPTVRQLKPQDKVLVRVLSALNCALPKGFAPEKNERNIVAHQSSTSQTFVIKHRFYLPEM